MTRLGLRIAAVFLLLLLGGCYALRPSSGGGQTTFDPPRGINVADIALPRGYAVEAVTKGLTFPTGVAFDDAGGVFVVESGYSYGEVWTVPRLLRIEPEGSYRVIAEGGKRGPWTGVTWHDGAFFVSEGSQLEGGRILRITPDGQMQAIVDGLPSFGDHHTNAPLIGPDGMLYFSQGTATNSGVVGEDNANFGWLQRFPGFHDIACRDLTLRGENFATPNPLQPGSKQEVETGAFSPFGTRTEPGQVVPGRLPCSGAILRVSPEGGELELVAWGLRNPFGLAFTSGGRLYATDNAYDVRGSRPVFGAGDLLWEIEPGQWYGWPDFHGGQPLAAGDRFKAPRQPPPPQLLAEHPQPPPTPAAILGVHSSSNGFDFSRNPVFGFVGEAFIAQLGDEGPVTGKVMRPVGFKVVRVNVHDGVSHDFAVNRGKENGPASYLGTGGLERPVAARFDRDGTALYVVDFGVMLHDREGAMPVEKSGVLWRIVRMDQKKTGLPKKAEK